MLKILGIIMLLLFALWGGSGAIRAISRVVKKQEKLDGDNFRLFVGGLIAVFLGVAISIELPVSMF